MSNTTSSSGLTCSNGGNTCNSNLLPPYTPQNPFRQETVKNPWSVRGWKVVRCTTTAITGPEITDAVLLGCVGLFNNHFGVWSEVAEQFDQRARAGSPIRTTVSGLRRQCVPCEEACTLVRHYVDDKFVGYAFATRWTWRKMEEDVCWITQMVVHRNFRGVGIATRLLNKLKTGSDALFGIISSHPAALVALSTVASGTSISNANLDFIRKHVSQVLRGSNIDYLRSTKLHGSLFTTPNTVSGGECEDEDEDEDDGTICCVETEFFMRHDEALQALDYLENRRRIQWLFGDLLEGVEFVLLVENMDRVVAGREPVI